MAASGFFVVRGEVFRINSVKNGVECLLFCFLTVSLPVAKKACYDEEIYRFSVDGHGDKLLQ